MKTSDPQNSLPPGLAKKLSAIRRRGKVVILLRGLILSATVLLGVMVAAMLLDLAVGWFDSRARYAATFVALGCVAAVFGFACLRPLARRRTIVATAREVDETIPQLEERWSTVAELSLSQDSPEVRGSDAMIRRVVSEAETAGSNIAPATIISARPVYGAARWLAMAAAAFAVLFAINSRQAQLLFQRFWHPGLDLSLTRVGATPSGGWVAKGESLTLAGTITGRIPGQPPRVYIRTHGAGERTLAMTAKGHAADTFQYVMDSVSDSFQYRVRAGDGQSPWQDITAVDRPKISEVKLRVTPPAYSGLKIDEKTSLPNTLRVLEGSEIEVGFRADQPLDRLLLDLGDGQTKELSADQDRWYAFRSRLTNGLTFTAAAINSFKLENKIKPSCRISVYEDLPPTVAIVEPSDEVAVSPGEKVDVTFEATDDFGIAQAELIVASLHADGTTNILNLPVDLGDDSGSKEIRKTVSLDLNALGLTQGDQLSLVVQVTDSKQLPAQAGASPLDSAKSQQAALSDRDQAKNPTDPTDPRNAAVTAGIPKDPQNRPPTPSSSSPSSAKNAQAGAPKNSQLAARQKSDKPSPRPANENPPPPNDMAMRTLDAGQSSTCKPMNIKVDAWAGSFDGERRMKLEIAIDPVIQRLETLLGEAQTATESLKVPAASESGLQPVHAAALAAAREPLEESQRTISELNAQTTNSPYAFVGLQLHNIAEAHIAPAQKSLGQIDIGSQRGADQTGPIDRAAFHIARAQGMLADLTRTYETVKRDQQIGESMQKLDKMYQIFLEDTQALLGASKGPINKYQRKVAEVDDAYVKKLKELLEQKKKIMAELAKVLAQDPRLLRRYLAMLQLQGTSFRDQLTLLAEAQKQLTEQVATWNSIPESERDSFVDKFKDSPARQARTVPQAASQLRENMETWLPLEVSADDPMVQAAMARAEKVVQWTSAGPAADAPKAALRALGEIRALRKDFLKFSEIASTNKARMSAYIANRLPEVDTLITQLSGEMKISESLEKGDFTGAAEVIQHRITQDTVALGEKLDATEAQIANLSPEIADKAAVLNKTLQKDVIDSQKAALDRLATHDVKAAGELLHDVDPAFAQAEQTFDELMRMIIAKMDEAPPPDSPGGNQKLDSLLGVLQDEMKAAEGLGIPCRPVNVAIMKDWMRPGSNSGQGTGQGQAQALAAQAVAQQAKAQTQRVGKEARDNAQKALSDSRSQIPPATGALAEAKPRGDAWNTLTSKLKKDMLQGRDNTPPEQYRDAIENYFKVISETQHKTAR